MKIEKILSKYDSLIDASKGTGLEWYFQGVKQGIFWMYEEAKNKNYEGQIGIKPSHSWSTWLRYWTKLLADDKKRYANYGKHDN